MSTNRRKVGFNITRRDAMKGGMGTATIAALGTGAALPVLAPTPARGQIAAEYQANYPARYMGADARLVKAPNGGVVYDKALEAASRVWFTSPVVEKITDGIWVIGGHSIVNCIVLDAPQGLIVYDTGDFGEEGKHFRSVIEKEISKKPIMAIIYSHSHYALGGGNMVDNPKSTMVLGHPKLNGTVQANLQGGGAPSAIPEIGPALTARAAIQFSNFLPTEGEDATLAVKLQVKAPAFLPVNRPVNDGEIVDVAGVKLQFFTKYISDDYCTTVWWPEKKAVLNNFFWPGTPNLYSLRGAVYRDPQVWRDGLKVLRDLQPEYLLNTHARPISGAKQVAEAITNYSDLISLTYDQTLRGILKGLGPDDLRYFIYKPAHLADAFYNAEVYGETPWFPPAVFYYQMGWFDRDVTQLFKLPPKDEATRLVALMGGQDKVIAASRAALDKKEYAWAAQLVNYVYKLDPDSKQVRQIKADALRKMGQLAVGSIGRSFLLSEARALEGKESIPKLVPPNLAVIAASPATFVQYHRVRIDPRKAETTDNVIAFAFGDKTVGLHVRRGVAEFLPEPDKYERKADVRLAMDGATWAKLYLNQADLKSLVDSGAAKVTSGTLAEASALLDLFDKFDPAMNVTVQHLHLHD
jgi:alkyl sulfatase BDS1-like metallo-beta-lactamase superfamily hydrolase